jgi:phosphoribosylamine--glycine ligase
MKVLLYGGGAREHALAWKISQSKKLSKLYLCKPNDGFKGLGEIIEASNFAELAQIAKTKNIDLLMVGPENPLSEGIVDEFKKVNIPAIGPDKKWAMLEGSKAYAKEFMVRNNIQTAGYSIVEDKNNIDETLKKFTAPVVLKADGLAAGKGVVIAQTIDEARTVLYDFLDGKYGEASKRVVVEEFLVGEEVSLISIWDGKTLLPLIPARDYKKLLNDNKGPNTGGMGAYCPVDITEKENTEIQQYIKTLETALLKEKADFAGIIYSGLILTQSGIKILEYNMRFGDPETQPLLMHLKTDLLDVFEKAVNQQLDKVSLSWNDGISFCVVIAANGYPENPIKGGEIVNIDDISKKFGVNIFYAGVKTVNNKLVANGGRVLSICKSGINPLKDINNAAEELIFADKYFRNDIGGVLCKNL